MKLQFYNTFAQIHWCSWTVDLDLDLFKFSCAASFFSSDNSRTVAVVYSQKTSVGETLGYAGFVPGRVTWSIEESAPKLTMDELVG